MARRLLHTTFLGLAALLAVSAKATVTSTWSGASATDGNVLDLTNWNTLPLGTGGNLIFPAVTNTTVKIKASDLVSLLGSSTIIVDDITFTSATGYDFVGVGSPTLKIRGVLSTQGANTVTFDNSLALELAAGAGRVDLASNSHVLVNSTVTGAGSLDKEGSGTLSFNGAATYTGGTLVQAGKLELNNGGSITHSAADLTVAQGTNFSHLELNSGATVSAANTHAAVVSGGNAQIDLDGAGASLTNAGYLYLGETGTATMTVSNGGAVSSANTSVGNNSGGNGYLYVDTGGSVTNSDTLYVGSAGYGTLYVENGSTVTNAHGVVANNTGGIGLVGVFNAGSHWNNTSDLIVGGQSVGNLYIYDGAKVTVDGGEGTLTLGSNTGGVGHLFIGDSGLSGGILNAHTVTTGAGTGSVTFVTTGTGASPYYFTRDGTSSGAGVRVTGTTSVNFIGGYNVLTATSAYTGTTTITSSTVLARDDGSEHQLGYGAVTVNSGGTLALQNGYLGNSTVAINSGAKLSGTGGIADGSGLTTSIFSGGKLAPGLSGSFAVGSLVFDDLKLYGGSTVEWNLQDPNSSIGSGWDYLYIADYSATLHIDSSANTTPITLKLISLDATGTPGMATGFLNQAYSWEIFDGGPVPIDFAGSSVLNPALFTIDSSQFTTDIGPGAFSLAYNSSSRALSLQFTPVPEPSTYALIGLGLGAVALRCRRRLRF